MKKIYIASPYTKGDTAQHVRAQIDAANTLAKRGYLPFWPLASHFWHMIHPHTWDFWMTLDKAWIAHMDGLLRMPGESQGADIEEETAMALGLPVFYSIAELEAHQW